MLLTVNSHSSIKVDDMFFDPYNVDDNFHDTYDTTNGEIISQKVTDKMAKFIFITHTHFDHLSLDDIKKVADTSTTFIIPKDAESEITSAFKNNKILIAEPNQIFNLNDMKVEVLPAYNINKKFHPKENSWLGYKVTKNNVSFAVLGDTDNIPELENLKVDILTIPIGGTFTMNFEEASRLTNIVQPKVVIPVHYGLLDGTGSVDIGENFKNLVNKKTKTIILIK